MESELVEDVERIIIRALAQQSKAARLNLAEEEDPDSLDVTRQVINAIADEMDAESDKGLPDSYELFRSVRWLRAQAGEE